MSCSFQGYCLENYNSQSYSLRIRSPNSKPHFVPYSPVNAPTQLRLQYRSSERTMIHAIELAFVSSTPINKSFTVNYINSLATIDYNGQGTRRSRTYPGPQSIVISIVNNEVWLTLYKLTVTDSTAISKNTRSQ